MSLLEHENLPPDSPLEVPGLVTVASVGRVGGPSEENGSLLELATTFGPPW